MELSLLTIYLYTRRRTDHIRIHIVLGLNFIDDVRRGGLSLSRTEYNIHSTSHRTWPPRSDWKRIGQSLLPSLPYVSFSCFLRRDRECVSVIITTEWHSYILVEEEGRELSARVAKVSSNRVLKFSFRIPFILLFFLSPFPSFSGTSAKITSNLNVGQYSK